MRFILIMVIIYLVMQNPEIKNKVTSFINEITKNLNKTEAGDALKDVKEKVKKN